MANTPEGVQTELARKILVPTVLLAAIALMVFMFALLDAQGEARAERVHAWQAMVEAASTDQERELMSFLASRIPGCFVNASRDPSRLAPSFSWSLSQYKENQRDYLIAHEQVCLTNLRGEALASTPEGRDRIVEVSVPR